MTNKIVFWLLLLAGAACLNYGFLHRMPALPVVAGIMYAAAIWISS